MNARCNAGWSWPVGMQAFGRRAIVTVAACALIRCASIDAADAASDQPAAAATSDAKLVQPAAPAEALKAEAPKPEEAPVSSFRATVRALVEQEVKKTGLPADIADAVVRVESNYDPTVIGGVGEIGLMQIRPATAAMLGFRGSADELAKPEVNIHYGVTYLSKAWRLANGDLCRTLMKYRAGHGEETMTARSVNYCNKARSHLAALGSPLATENLTPGAPPPAIVPASVLAESSAPKPMFSSPKEIYARYKQGTAAASRAFWANHEARIHAITARIEAKWHRVALR
jgi:Transglycosylase SLT domain